MAEERNQRKVYQGRVVSDKSNKTITVEVSTYKKHATYGKRVRYSKKFTAHDENNEKLKPVILFKSWNTSIVKDKAFPFD